MPKLASISVAFALCFASPCLADLAASDTTQVVILGTGTPNADPERFGPDGIEEMASHILKAYRADIDYRVYGLEPATRAKPKLLVLYHVLFWGASEETVLREVREKYAGEVVLADDLDVFQRSS